MKKLALLLLLFVPTYAMAQSNQIKKDVFKVIMYEELPGITAKHLLSDSDLEEGEMQVIIYPDRFDIIDNGRKTTIPFKRDNMKTTSYGTVWTIQVTLPGDILTWGSIVEFSKSPAYLAINIPTKIGEWMYIIAV